MEQAIAADQPNSVVAPSVEQHQRKRGIPKRLAACLSRASEEAAAKDAATETAPIEGQPVDLTAKLSATQEFAALVSVRFENDPSPGQKPRKAKALLAVLSVVPVAL